MKITASISPCGVSRRYASIGIGTSASVLKEMHSVDIFLLKYG